MRVAAANGAVPGRCRRAAVPGGWALVSRRGWPCAFLSIDFRDCAWPVTVYVTMRPDQLGRQDTGPETAER